MVSEELSALRVALSQGEHIIQLLLVQFQIQLSVGGIAVSQPFLLLSSEHRPFVQALVAYRPTDATVAYSHMGDPGSDQQNNHPAELNHPKNHMK